MQKTQSRSIFLTLIVLLVLITSSTYSMAASAAEITESMEDQQEKLSHWFNLEGTKIGIFYDNGNNLTRETGESLFYSLSLMTPSIVGVPITNFDQINLVLESEEIDIALYVFPSSYDGMIITERGNKFETIGWEEVAGSLIPEVIHVFATGNTIQLFNFVSPDLLVYGPNTEKEDAKQLFVFALWTLADVLEEHFSNDSTASNFAEDIRMASLQFFADNLNDLVTRTIEPQDAMGVEHPSTIEARTQAFYDRNPHNMTKFAHEGYVIDPQTLREVDPVTGELREDYGIDLFPKTSSTASDFILQLLPAESGLRGPLGGIVDELLSWLFDLIGGAIGLDEGTVENIANALFAIPDLIGAISDPSASKIKDFIDDIIPMLPIPQDLTQYIDLIIDALFLLRGELSDVLNFIKGAVDLLIPEETFSLGGKSAAELLGTVFDLAGKVEDQINDGGNIADVILSVLNEEMLKFVINATLTNAGNTLFGLTPTQLTDGIDYLVGSIGIIVNLIATGNFKSIVETYGPKLLDQVLSGLLPGITEQHSKIIMKMLSMILTTAGVMNGPTLEEVLTDIVLEDLGLTGITLHYVSVDGISEDALAAGAKVKAIIDKVGNVIAALKDGSYSLATFQSDLDTLLAELSIDNDLKKAIKDVLAIVVAISDSNFDLGSAVNIGTMVTNLLQSFGAISGGQADVVTKILNALVGVVSFIKNPPNLKEVIKDLIPDLDDMPGLINDLLTFIMNAAGGALNNNNQALQTQSLPTHIDAITGQALSSADIIKLISDAAGTIIQIVGSGGENALEGIMKALLTGGTFILNAVLDTDITPFVELLKGVFGTVIGLTDSAPSLDDITALILPLVPGFESEVSTLLSFIMKIKDVFNDGFRTIFTQLTAFLAQTVIDLVGGLAGDVDSALGGVQDDSFKLFEFDIPIGIGGFSLFTIKIGLGLEPGFEFDVDRLAEMIFDLVFRGTQIFEVGADAGEVLKTAFSFFTITPILVASFELADFGSGESSFITFLLESLGLQLSFSGYGFFKLQLFSFKNGQLNFDDFFKVVEWGFGFKITISKTLTLLDFLTGGAGGSLNAIGKYIGLDAISITIAFSIGLDIVKRAATATAPETGSMTITFGISFHVQIGIDIVIAKLILFGTLEVVLTLLQDLVAPTPLRVFISVQLTIGVTIGFLFFEWTFDYKWSPSGFEPPMGKEITSPDPADAKEKGALGGDQDGDGLSDEYEDNTPGLDKTKKDSDGDNLEDKFETQTSKTDPGKADTDQDGLNDDIEIYNILTDPLNPDSDFDGLTDGEESAYYQTSPLELDSDGDGLDDFYEVKHSWNMSQITPSVKDVLIGDQLYNDHTDPLNPDTDGDGLLDGEEGERGMHYGPDLYPLDLGEDENGDDVPAYVGDSPPLVFNGGYTHPLDNDTDDDSYWQLWDGSIAPVEIPYLQIDMTDLREVEGRSVIFIDPLTGIPEAPRIVRTNPTNPDTDGDTGIGGPEDREDPPFGFFLNSDGYELSRDPPTDPLDGDTDDDGLLDGLEGMLRPDSNHTHAVNPDTDGDGLGDMQELTLGTDGRSVDTDLDGIPDGDEFFRFHTNPFLADSDFDGVEDGEEVYFYHSNPMQKDSDIDGLSDYEEIWIYFSNPVDEDSDNDFLTDWEEIFITYTDPFNKDSDYDGLFDGEEIQGFLVPSGVEGEWYNVTTDPNLWDTDADSLLTLDQNGEISMSMSDYDEFLLGTNPTIRDSDNDGIEDGWELYLGTGKVPWMDPVTLDPVNNDTDDDGLLDGMEMYVGNVTTLLNPYIGFVLVTPYNTSAANNDTDGDGLTDKYELINNINPANPDTDNDTLTDWWEVFQHGTSPINNDSDGDGLSDAMEVNGFDSENLLSLSIVIGPLELDPLNPDSDGDLLPDGAEISRYGRDPTNPDENLNEILDGMEIDSDNDGLMDGQEYFEFKTQQSPYGGGVDNVDSDRDGLFDGFEAYQTYSSPVEWDTDKDNLSDGLEWFCGTDMLDNSTTQAEIDACFAPYITITILSPAHKTYKSNSLPVVVFDRSESMVSMEYRYKPTNDTNWSSSVPMTESLIADNYWEANYLALPEESGEWELEVTAESNTSETFTRRVVFTLDIDFDGLEIKSPKAQTYSFNELEDPELPIQVAAGLNYEEVWYRMRKSGGALLKPENTTLELNPNSGVYQQSKYKFPDEDGTKTYVIEVFARTNNGTVITRSNVFKIKTPTITETIITVAVPVAATATLVTVVARSSRFKNPFRKSGV
jgi:hypothetical protein